MSYEGYEIWLCERGHQHTFDAHNGPDRREWVCPDCEKMGLVSFLAWFTCVDQTNGIDEETDIEPGWVKLETDKPAKTCTCKECGHVRVVEDETYKIPENEGYKVPTPQEVKIILHPDSTDKFEIPICYEVDCPLKTKCANFYQASASRQWREGGGSPELTKVGSKWYCSHCFYSDDGGCLMLDHEYKFPRLDHIIDNAEYKPFRAYVMANGRVRM